MLTHVALAVRRLGDARPKWLAGGSACYTVGHMVEGAPADSAPWYRKLGWLDYIALVAMPAGTIALFLSFYNKNSSGQIRWWFAGFQIGLTILAAAVPAIVAVRNKLGEARAQYRERLAREKALEQSNATLDPIVRVIAKAVATSTNGLSVQVMWLVLNAAYETIAPKDHKEKVRVCFFDYQKGPPEKVVPTDYHVGRPGKPQTEFEEGTDAGGHVISMIQTGKAFTCEDITKKPPPGWGNKVSEYKTFVSAPVAVGNVAYGMLSIDSTRVGDLKEDRDEDPLMVLAGVLAVALGLDPISPAAGAQPAITPPGPGAPDGQQGS
jgi:hypothetical protein